MSIFEIEGVAKKEVECDIANIEITFKASGKNSHEISKKVMDQCDSFLEKASRADMDIKTLSYGGDCVNESRYSNEDDIHAERTIKINIPFDMKRINLIQSILQDGKYDYMLSVDGSVSYRTKLRTELSKEALLKSKQEAEQLAEVLGLRVKGVESIRHDRWDDGEYPEWGCCEQEYSYSDYLKSRISDGIAAEKTEESVNLKVKWILE